MADVTINFIPPDEPDQLALRVYEGTSAAGPFAQIDRTTDIGAYTNYITSFTTTHATDNNNWFTIAWEDISNIVGAQSPPVQGGTSPNEIMASLSDINANLPADYDIPVVVANSVNTAFLQISVARVIRGYLSRVITNVTLGSWTNPGVTPEIIREIAGKLIASQLFYNHVAKTSSDIDLRHYSQLLYNQAVALLQQIITGEIIIPGIETDSTGNMTVDDFFPIDSTNRAFTLGQQF